MAEGSNKSLITLNVIQLVVICILAYLLVDGKKQIETLNTSITASTEEISGLKADLLGTRENLEKVKAERQALGLSVDSLNVQLAEIDKVVAQLERKNNLSQAEIRKLSKKIVSLNQQIETQTKEISQLKDTNQMLTKSVDSLSVKTTQLTENVEKLNVEKDHLQHDLKIASILNAENIEIVGFRDNDKKLEKQPFKAKQLARFKVTFSLGENKAAEHNTKKFLLRMITPSGECFSDKLNGGGVFKDHEGNEMKYTLSKTLAFENSNQWLSMVMPKGFNYAPGNYIIQVYCEGYDIGQSSFIVK